MTASTGIWEATRGDQERIAGLMARAFVDDPVSRWIWPDREVRYRALAETMVPYGARALDHGTGLVAGDFAAAALWLPPGVTMDGDDFIGMLAESVPEPALGQYLEQADRLDRHHPAEPHWYLPMIGADPAHRGQGHGTALLAHGLALADRDRLPVYLESSAAANLTLYLRHGFEVLEEVRIGDSPPKYALLRPARRRWFWR